MSDLDELREYYSPLLDDALDPDERGIVENELADSAEALRELHDLKQLNKQYASLKPQGAPDHFEETVMARIHPEPSRSSGKMLVIIAGLLLIVGAGIAIAIIGLPSSETAVEPQPEPSPAATTESAAGTVSDEVMDQETPAESVTPEAAPAAAEDDTSPREAEGIDGLSTEATRAPGAPVGLKLGAFAKQDDLPDATGTRASFDGNVFYRRNMMWLQEGFDGTQGMPIEVGSEAAEALAQKAPWLPEATKLGPVVVARVDGTWYFFHNVRTR
jgi:hypothetical protein